MSASPSFELIRTESCADAKINHHHGRVSMNENHPRRARFSTDSSPFPVDKSNPSAPPVTTPSAETIDEFDHLLVTLFSSIRQLVQNQESGDAEQLKGAVSKAKQEISEHYLKTAVSYNSDREAVDSGGFLDDLRKHKAEADRLRLSLHEQSELLSETTRQRDEAVSALVDRDGLIRELADQKRQRGEENVELRALKEEVSQLNVTVRKADFINHTAIRDLENAEKNAETANDSKNTALKWVDNMKWERDAARVERDAAREERYIAVREKAVVMRRLDELERFEQTRVHGEKAKLEEIEKMKAATMESAMERLKAERAKMEASRMIARQEALKDLGEQLGQRKRKVSVVGC